MRVRTFCVNNIYRYRKYLEHILTLLIVFDALSQLFVFQRYHYYDKKEEDYPIVAFEYPDIDVVYTWVNGKDPDWLAQKNLFYKQFVHEYMHMDTNDSTTKTITEKDKVANGDRRYRDHEELKYSLRSLEKYAPWVRRIHLVVSDNQIPPWLDMDTSHPKIHIVQHSEIFENSTYLPTFNSYAIESQLDNIPDLASYFLYFNDDMFLGQPVSPSDFFVSKKTGQQIKYDEGWPIQWTCAEDCFYGYLQDGWCDHVCNVPECNWDFGDCGGTERIQQGKQTIQQNLKDKSRHFNFNTTAPFWETINHVDGTYNREFLLRRSPRNLICHHPLLVNKHLLKDLKKRLPSEFDWTASHRFRHPEDMMFSFSYMYYLEAVQVYAPTKEQAWQAAFHTFYTSQEIFLYDHLPDDWDHIEKQRYDNIIASNQYEIVKQCVVATQRDGNFDYNNKLCQTSMDTLLNEYNLRLPFYDLAYGFKERVQFEMLSDDEENSLRILNELKSSRGMFVTINDDMTVYNEKVEKAIDEMFDWLFPRPSQYEKGKSKDRKFRFNFLRFYR